jgi:AP-3 complex subunit delta-1
MSSTHIEVQERACFYDQFIRMLKEQREKGIDLADELRAVADEVCLQGRLY